MNGAAQLKVLAFPACRKSSDRRMLTPREAAVMGLVRLHNSDIAALLGIKISTVKTHIEHALEKLGADTRTQAALIWHEERRRNETRTAKTARYGAGDCTRADGPAIQKDATKAAAA